MGRLSLLVAVIGLAALAGCTPEPSRSPLTPTAVAFLVDAERADLKLDDPSIMDDEMRRAMDEEVGRGGTAKQRVEHLRDWLHYGKRPFVHDPTLTTDARTAFHARRGGCMAHAILFTTLARYLGVQAYYVHAVSAREYADSGEGMVAMTHVAVGFNDGPNERVLDMWTPFSDFKMVRYEPIDDTSALALYYSNVAVDDLHHGRLAKAEKLLRFLDDRSDVAEVGSNLTAVLVREHRYDDALATARQTMARFPTFKPLYTNGYLAAIGTGDDALAETFASKSREILENDPIFLVARGVSEYEHGRFEQAVRSFERARDDKDDSVVIHAWLVRAYLAAGNARSGQEALDRAMALSPNDPRLARLVEEHPELRAAR